MIRILRLCFAGFFVLACFGVQLARARTALIDQGLIGDPLPRDSEEGTASRQQVFAGTDRLNDFVPLEDGAELPGIILPIPPLVAITNPLPGAALATGYIPIDVTATDPDGMVTLVEFYADDVKIGEDALSPYTFDWWTAILGNHTVSAVATDDAGLSATSAPVNIEVSGAIVPIGSIWKYLDDGSNQGAGWREFVFDDSGWSNGAAQLGYGEGDEATIVAGGAPTNRYITTYFRHVFNVVDSSAFSNLVVRVQRDDGAVVYLNGIEIFRSNLPDGPVDFDTLAADIVPNGPTESLFYATNINAGVLTNGPNILAVEIHQGNKTSDDISFDLELIPNVPLLPPVITLDAPTNNAQFLAFSNVTVYATATDFDDPVAWVDFYVGADWLARDTVEPYSFVLSNPPVGIHQLFAIATDKSGLSTASSPVSFTVIAAPILTTLVATGSVWKYLDDGSDQGTAWRDPTFDDTDWNMGNGELGYGDLLDGRPEATVICCSNASPHSITTYFRHHFYSSNVVSITNLAFGVMRDDGAVVYLNGMEIFRMNMPPTNPITFMTTATLNVGGANEAVYYPTNIGAGALLTGSNVLAVEIHQNTPNSADVSFDLRLVAIATPFLQPPPIFISRAGEDIIISWTGSGFVLQEASAADNGWSDLLLAVSPYIVTMPTDTRFYRLRSP